jgi:hypothetical protein
MPRVFPAIVPDHRILALFTNASVQLKASQVLALLGVVESRIRNIASALKRLARSGHLIELPSLHPRFNTPRYTLPPASGEQQVSRIAASDPPAADDSTAVPSSDVSISTAVPSSSSVVLAAPALAVDRPFVSIAAHSMRPADPLRVMQLIERSDDDSWQPPVVDDDCEIVERPQAESEDEAEENDSNDHPPLDPAHPCIICQTARATEVLMPCRHQTCCKQCWDRWVGRQKYIHNIETRQRRALSIDAVQPQAFVMRCHTCKQPVVDIISPYQA